MFYVVDGDAYLEDNWNFNYQPGLFDRDCVYVWSSKNPINDLVYGYGGVKLFSKSNLIKKSKMLLNHDAPIEKRVLDLTTSVSNKIKVISKISNVTQFNTDEFSAWKSAFRECLKLYYGMSINPDYVSTDTKNRLEKWRTLGVDKPFGQYCLDGASHAIEYVDEHLKSYFEILFVNDRQWLENEFDKRYPGVRKN
jgi:hypothetical protein